MNIILKSAMAAALVAGSATAISTPAAAQSSFGVWVGSGPGYGGYRGYRGYRDGPRYRHYRGYDDRRWGYRSNWRGGYRDGWRGERCWREWRYDPYRRRDVRVRICR